MSTGIDIVVGVLAIVSACLFVLAGLGVLRFPDLYTRMHAATKATALGALVLGIAAAIALDDGRGKVVLATIFILITAPSSAHFVGRIAHRAEGIQLRLDDRDDLAASDDGA